MPVAWVRPRMPDPRPAASRQASARPGTAPAATVFTKRRLSITSSLRTGRTALLRTGKLRRFAGPGKESAAGIGKLAAGVGGPVVSFGRESPLHPNAAPSCDGPARIRRLTRLRGCGSDASSRARRAERARGVLDEDQPVVRIVESEERPERPFHIALLVPDGDHERRPWRDRARSRTRSEPEIPRPGRAGWQSSYEGGLPSSCAVWGGHGRAGLRRVTWDWGSAERRCRKHLRRWSRNRDRKPALRYRLLS